MSQMKVAMLVTGLAMMAVSATGLVAQPVRREANREEATMSRREQNIQIMLEIFRAIEERDPRRENVQRELALVQPDVEFHWPPSLPYGGTFRGLARNSTHTWDATWTPLQPTSAERRMNPRVIGADDNEVAILYHQRGVSPSGERFDGEVLGLYQLRDSKLSRAQMFYFDEAAACAFLARAATVLVR